MRKSGILRNIEPILLFSVIFLPGYLTQTLMETDPEMFNNGALLFIYMVTAVPQIFLVLYIIYGDRKLTPEVYGIIPLKPRSLLLSFPVLGGIFLALIPVYIINAILLLLSGDSVPEGVQWQFTNFRVLPMVLLSCLATGYLEELFFRSFLTTRFTFHNMGRIQIILLVNLLFAVGHIYQGLPGLIGTFIIGVYLTFVFFVFRDIHTVAIAHGLYNFTILLISSFLPV